MRNQPTTREIRNARIKLKAKMRITHKCLVRLCLNNFCKTEHLGAAADLKGIKFNINIHNN